MNHKWSVYQMGRRIKRYEPGNKVNFAMTGRGNWIIREVIFEVKGLLYRSGLTFEVFHQGKKPQNLNHNEYIYE